MALKVHIQVEPDDTARTELFKELDNDVEITWGSEPPETSDYAILVSGRPSEELLNASPSMNTVVVPWAGMPAQTLDRLRSHPELVVHNLHHNATATAEIAIGLLLAAAKNVVSIDARLRRGDWTDRGQMDRALQLEGEMALVLGFGEIGKRVARASRGLGMEVHAVARRKHSEEPHIEIHSPGGIDDLLPRARAVVVCLPATDETRGMLNASRIGMLRKDCVLVNVARGSIIDERALYDALKQRRIFGAGLDVWWEYPESREKWTQTLPSNLPFHELDNVVLSPHRGGHVSDTEVQRMRALAQLLNAAVRGEEIPNRVDLDAGY